MTTDDDGHRPTADLKLLGLDYRFRAACQLFIADVWHRLEMPTADSPLQLFKIGGKDGCWLRQVELAGMIVSRQQRHRHVVYEIDDGTGLIPVIQWADEDGRRHSVVGELPIGQWIRVRGRLSWFRNQLQLTCNQIWPEDDPNAEVYQIMRCWELRQRYFQPFTPGPESTRKILEMALKQQQTIDNSNCQNSELDPAKLEPTEESFKALLLQHIRSYRKPSIQFSDIRQHRPLIQFASRVLGLTASLHRIGSLFSRTMSLLVREAVVYLEDTETDTYTLISHEYNLGQSIYDLIKNYSNPSEDEAMQPRPPDHIQRLLDLLPKMAIAATDGGKGKDSITTDRLEMPETELIIAIQDMPRFRHVLRKTIQASINRLIADSLIFESSRKSYRAL